MNVAQSIDSQSSTVGPLVGLGWVRHERSRPTVHAFRYRSFFLLLPLRHMAAKAPVKGPLGLGWNRRSGLSFYDRDHGDGRSVAQGGALAWLVEWLATQGVTDADGEIWLQCYPRVLGYVFKPVSFWYCQRQDGSLRCIVVEVNNTFGARHFYLLQGEALWQNPLWSDKALHVSPFCQVEGVYRFWFLRQSAQQPDENNAGRSMVVIDYFNDDQRTAKRPTPLLHTTWSGQLMPLTRHNLWRAWWRCPLQSYGVIARIHWQALRLWWRGVRFHGTDGTPE